MLKGLLEGRRLDRRHAVFGLTLGCAFWSTSVLSQSHKTYRIGGLGPDSPDADAMPYQKAIFDSLRQYGYESGRNLSLEMRWANGDVSRLPALARELVALNPDLLITAGTPAAKALKAATQTIPIVVVVSGDPVGTGLAQSLARPGANITGSTFIGSQLAAKRVELIRDAFPHEHDLGVVVNPENAGAMAGLSAAISAAEKLKYRVHRIDVHNGSEIEQAIHSLAKKKIQALLMDDDALTRFGKTASIVTLAVQYRMAIFADGSVTEAGGLAGYEPDLMPLYRRTGYFVDRIFKGAKPGDIPIEQATKFDLVLNLKTAKALGLKLPQALLQRADKVIQ